MTNNTNDLPVTCQDASSGVAPITQDTSLN